MERVKEGFRKIDLEILKKQNDAFIRKEYPSVANNLLPDLRMKDIFSMLLCIRMRPSFQVSRFGENEYFDFVEDIIEIVLGRDKKWVPSYFALRYTLWLDSDKIARLFLDRCLSVYQKNIYLEEDKEYTLFHKMPGIFSEAVLTLRIELSKVLLEYGWSLSMITYYHSEKYRIKDLFKDKSVPTHNPLFYKMLTELEESFNLLVKEK